MSVYTAPLRDIRFILEELYTPSSGGAPGYEDVTPTRWTSYSKGSPAAAGASSSR